MTELDLHKKKLELKLSQQIQALHSLLFGQEPTKITCQLIDNIFVVVLEGSNTSPEQFLVDRGQLELARQVRQQLDAIFHPELKRIVAEQFQQPVLEMLGASRVETGYSVATIILAH